LSFILPFECYNFENPKFWSFYMEICIRYAGAVDNHLLAEAGSRLFNEAFAAQNTPENMEAYLRASFGSEIQAFELADPTSVTFIAEIKGVFAGYARLKEGRPALVIPGRHPIELVRIYAERNYIGQGVGSALMKASLEEASLRECDVIWLGVWELNTRAIRFYERWGFVKAGTKAFKLGEDVQTDFVLYRL
jgi:ribosomal protein S18 acetylase RimI-like enzyme